MKSLFAFVAFMLLFSSISADDEIRNCTIVTLSDGSPMYKLEIVEKWPDGKEYISEKFSKTLPAGFKKEKESYKEFATRMTKEYGWLFLETFALGWVYIDNSDKKKMYDERIKSKTISGRFLTKEIERKKRSTNLESAATALSISLDAVPRFCRFVSDVREWRRDKAVRE